MCLLFSLGKDTTFRNCAETIVPRRKALRILGRFLCCRHHRSVGLVDSILQKGVVSIPPIPYS